VECTRIRNGEKNMVTRMMDLKQKVKTKIYTASQTQTTVGEPRDQLFYLFSNVLP